MIVIEVEACLQAVITTFAGCGKGLGMDISFGVVVDCQIEVLEAYVPSPTNSLNYVQFGYHGIEIQQDHT